jgi:hypothetical protein
MRTCPALHGNKRPKLLLFLLVVEFAHVVKVSVTDLVFVTVIPSPGNLVFMEALHNDRAIHFQLIVKGSAALNLILAAKGAEEC